MALSRITNPFLSSSGAGNASITSPAANVVAFTTATTERMRVTAAGNFGVGTASPLAKIHSTKAGAEVARFTNSGSNGGDWEFKIGGGGFEDRKFMITDKYSGADDVRLSIDSAGLVTIASGQIKFPASQNASGDSNTLDDYEEGTYTPSVTGSTSGGPFTFGTQSGYYTKIGREVKVSMFMSHNSTITLGGAYKISLPFAVADYAGGGFVTYFANWIGQSPRIFQIEASTTYGYLRSFSTTEMVDMQTGHVQNNTSYMLTIIYKTT